MEEFRHALQDTLTHLHDPDFHPAAGMYAALNCEQAQGPVAVQLALTRLIERRGHAEDRFGGQAGNGPNAAEWQVLQQRFVLKLSQEETAARLNMSVRTLQRVQRRAVYMLARSLWEQSQVAMTATEVAKPGTTWQLPTEITAEDDAVTEPITIDATTGATSDWQAQVKQELESLHQVSAYSLSDVGLSLARVLTVGQAVAKRRGVIVETNATPPTFMATIHPSTLRHVLITAIEQMTQRMNGGTIRLAAQAHNDTIQITVSGTPLDASTPLQAEPIHEIVATHGGGVEVQSDGDGMRFAITLPSSGEKIVVMVIDDNADLVAFYRRYVAGTPYEIVHLADGNHVFAAIEETVPNIIVLDVLLPDLDGWELLTYLHEHPATRAIPILVASVVRGEELALALGAAAYMPKPVRRQQFIQALDQVRARDRA